MDPTRRQFMGACVLSSGALFFSESLKAHAAGRILMIVDLTQDAFKPHVGKSITVRAADGAESSLKLSGAKPLKPGRRTDQPGAPQTEGFRLMLEGSREDPLGQGIYSLVIPEVGETEGLFMVPVVSPPNSPQRYEIVINRLVEG